MRKDRGGFSGDEFRHGPEGRVGVSMEILGMNNLGRDGSKCRGPETNFPAGGESVSAGGAGLW